jgi:ferrous iron transport protein A
MSTLDTLTSGQCGTIVDLDGDDGITRRLMELGFLPGTMVEVIGFAPLGDPVAVFVRGGRIAIRLRDARRIRVNPATAS